jgi:predicted DNA-binding transcriptional regulator AlpA
VTADEIRGWPVIVDVPTAGRCFGMHRDTAYRRARAGTFPVPVMRVGRRLQVSRAAIMAALGITEIPTGATEAA